VDPVKLAADLHIQPQHVRLFGRFLDILEEDDVLRREGAGLVVHVPPALRAADELTADLDRLLTKYPAFEAELTLTRQCGPYLAEALTGGADPLQLLFPDGSSAVADRL
jgi:hypothetical protein